MDIEWQHYARTSPITYSVVRSYQQTANEEKGIPA